MSERPTAMAIRMPVGLAAVGQKKKKKKEYHGKARVLRLLWASSSTLGDMRDCNRADLFAFFYALPLPRLGEYELHDH